MIVGFKLGTSSEIKCEVDRMNLHQIKILKKKPQTALRWNIPAVLLINARGAEELQQSFLIFIKILLKMYSSTRAIQSSVLFSKSPD